MPDTSTIFAYCSRCDDLKEATDDRYGHDILAAWLRYHEPHRTPRPRAA